NIQLDVARMTGQRATLLRRHVNPLCKGLTPQQRAKALLLNIFGIEKLCNINRRMNKTAISRS
ncbi:MAG: hypothetical protein J5552_12290, partial [Prevotella sp.]|nr:hypothetical protein [Prevotella sp.]